MEWGWRGEMRLGSVGVRVWRLGEDGWMGPAAMQWGRGGVEGERVDGGMWVPEVAAAVSRPRATKDRCGAGRQGQPFAGAHALALIPFNRPEWGSRAAVHCQCLAYGAGARPSAPAS